MDAGAQEGRDLLEGQESPLLTVYGIHIDSGIALATPAPACGSRWSRCWNPGASDSWSLCIRRSPAYPLPLKHTHCRRLLGDALPTPHSFTATGPGDRLRGRGKRDSCKPESWGGDGCIGTVWLICPRPEDRGVVTGTCDQTGLQLWIGGPQGAEVHLPPGGLPSFRAPHGLGGVSAPAASAQPTDGAA